MVKLLLSAIRNSFRRRILALFLLGLLAGLSCVPEPQVIPLANYLTRVTPLVAERRYSEAISILEDAALAHLETPLPLVQLGQIYLLQHRWLLAEDAFNRALARDPHQPAALAGLAETMYQQGRLTEAFKLWKEAIAAGPQLPGVYTGLGRTYLSIFDFEAAEKAFLAQQSHPADPEALWYLAALTAPRDLLKARDYLQAITSEPPAAPTAQAEAAPVLFEGVHPPGEFLARRDYLLKALKPFTATSPQVEAAKATGIALAQVEMWPLAIHALTIANEAQPGDAETLAFLGYASAQAGRPALDIFEQARQADPKSALPLYFHGVYLRQKGVLDAAEDLFSQAVTLDPNNAAIYAELAETLAAQGSLIGAEMAYQKAVEVAADDSHFQLLLAQFYANQGYRMAEAGIPLVESIIRKDKNNAAAYELLGQMQFLSGAPDSGEAALQRALVLNPDLVGARFYLARLLAHNGQVASARVEYQRVIDWDTTGAFRDRALKDLQRLQ